mmetsp:Transcript_62907/g.112201  ORF Transcript_62907/g.112201 Transcript_62907/m.112201 type:complete len:465 (-) Transcript_62907:661-2055(-)
MMAMPPASPLSPNAPTRKFRPLSATPPTSKSPTAAKGAGKKGEDPSAGAVVKSFGNEMIKETCSIFDDFEEGDGDKEIRERRNEFNEIFRSKWKLHRALAPSEDIDVIADIVAYFIRYCIKNTAMFHTLRLRKTVYSFRRIARWCKRCCQVRENFVQAVIDFWKDQEEALRKRISKQAKKGSSCKKAISHYALVWVPDNIKQIVTKDMYFQRAADFRQRFSDHFDEKDRLLTSYANLNEEIENLRNDGWDLNTPLIRGKLAEMAVVKMQIGSHKNNIPRFKFCPKTLHLVDLVKLAKEYGRVHLMLQQDGDDVASKTHVPRKQQRTRKTDSPDEGESQAGDFIPYSQKVILENPYVRCGLTPPDDAYVYAVECASPPSPRPTKEKRKEGSNFLSASHDDFLLPDIPCSPQLTQADPASPRRKTSNSASASPRGFVDQVASPKSASPKTPHFPELSPRSARKGPS